MSPTHATCPACDTVLTISHDATVSVVCKKCHAVLERRGDSFRQVGTAPVVIPTRSTVANGMDGAYNGTRFTVTGHVQLSNEDGATWDEYYLVFDDGECGWLAQAQGRLLLLFRSNLPEDLLLPAFESLDLKDSLDLMPGLGALHVVEKGEARVEAASGQIPYLLRPGETYPYVDLAAMSSAFASLDYSTEPPTLFVGREITFADLGMQPATVEPVAQGESLYCTECGARMEVRNPGRSERVTCLQCRALFDVSSGRAAFIGTQDEAPVQPFTPLGSVGHFTAGDLTLIGFLQRKTIDEEGTGWFWEEYLLSDGEGGYRWLVCSDRHWTLFEPITGGSDIKPVVYHRGRAYKLFQHGEAQVTYLEGEFYWNVTVGQGSYTADFVHPPYMLSGEFSEASSTKGESNWTHGVYLPVAEVEKAFGVSGLPRPRTVAPNQPFNASQIYQIWFLASMAVFLIAGLFLMLTPSEKVFDETFTLSTPQDPEARKKLEERVQTDKGMQTVERHTFRPEKKVSLKGLKNIRVTARARKMPDNSWVEVVGYLIDDDTLDVQPFDLTLEYYKGIEDGEAWSDDDREKNTYVSSLPGGEYVLRLDLDRPPGSGPMSVQVLIEQGHPRWWHALIALVLLAIIPLITWLVQKSFETRRWRNSNVNPTGA